MDANITKMQQELQSLSALVRERDTQITSLKKLCFAVEAEKDKFREQCERVAQSTKEDIDALNNKLNTEASNHRRQLVELQYAYAQLQCKLSASHGEEHKMQLEIGIKEDDVDELREQLDILKLEMETTKAERDHFSHQKENYEERFQVLSEQWKQTESIFEEHTNHYTKKINQLQSQVTTLLGLKEDISSVASQKEKMLNQQLMDAKLQILELETSLSKAEEEVKQMKAESTRAQKKDTLQKVEKLEKKLEEKGEEIKELKQQEKSNKEKWQKKISEKEEELQQMKQGHDKAMKQKEKEISSLQTKLDDIQARCTALEGKEKTKPRSSLEEQPGETTNRHNETNKNKEAKDKDTSKGNKVNGTHGDLEMDEIEDDPPKKRKRTKKQIDDEEEEQEEVLSKGDEDYDADDTKKKGKRGRKVKDPTEVNGTEKKTRQTRKTKEEKEATSKPTKEKPQEEKATKDSARGGLREDPKDSGDTLDVDKENRDNPPSSSSSTKVTQTSKPKRKLMNSTRPGLTFIPPDLSQSTFVKPIIPSVIGHGSTSLQDILRGGAFKIPKLTSNFKPMNS